ncbi:MAG: hydroxyethylthiazole kinase [Rhizobiaceae bacterium]
MSNDQLLNEALEAISALRSEGAHVHSITNTVAQNFTANVLLACNATVSMTANHAEIESFVLNTEALHINLGTIDDGRIEAIKKAVAIAEKNSMPVSLDPVMIHISGQRRQLALEIATVARIVRGNARETDALGNSVDDDTCLVKTGGIDEVWMADRKVGVKNGHPLLGRVIATGCALGALISALSAKTDDPFTAGLAGVLWFATAGEFAAQAVDGPGSFQPAFIDQLHAIPTETIRQMAEIS